MMRTCLDCRQEYNVEDWHSCPAVRVKGDAATRKAMPIVAGCLDYFPDALLAVAELSRKGNEQHNPGEPLHWAREKSTDEADALVRHLLDRGTIDTDGVRHSTKMAWRALALLQKEIEKAAGLPLSRGSSVPVKLPPASPLDFNWKNNNFYPRCCGVPDMEKPDDKKLFDLGPLVPWEPHT